MEHLKLFSYKNLTRTLKSRDLNLFILNSHIVISMLDKFIYLLNHQWFCNSQSCKCTQFLLVLWLIIYKLYYNEFDNCNE